MDARMRWMEELLLEPEEPRLREKIRALEETLDHKFFELLTTALLAARTRGQWEASEGLLRLRESLRRLSPRGRQALSIIDGELRRLAGTASGADTVKAGSVASMGLLQKGAPELDFSLVDGVITRLKGRLIEELLLARDPAELEQMVRARARELDFMFFEVLTRSMLLAAARGDVAQAEARRALRTLLARASPEAAAAVVAADAELRQIRQQTQEELLRRLGEARSDAEFARLIVTGRAMLDDLLRVLDEQAHGTGPAGASAKALAERVRAGIRQMQAAAEEKLEASTRLLEELLRSEAPEELLARRLAALDESFFAVLEASLEEAQARDQEEAQQALTWLRTRAVELLRPVASQVSFASAGPALIDMQGGAEP